MSQYNTVTSALCRTSFNTLSDTVMQDKLRNLGVLFALTSPANRGTFQSDFFLKDRSTNRWQFEYAKKNCGADGDSIDECSGGEIKNASDVQGKGFFTISVDAKNPSNSGFTTKYSKAINITDDAILSYCSGVDSSKEAYMTYVASQMRENYINLLRAVDADLANQLYTLAQSSLHADGVTFGDKYVQLLNPASGGVVTTNPQWDVALKTDFANLGLDYDNQIKVTTNLTAEYWASAKRVTIANQLTGVDATLATDNAIAIYPDTNLGTIAGNNSYMLSLTPGIVHLVTYSKSLRGISYDTEKVAQFTQNIASLRNGSGVDAAIAFALNNAKFSDSRSKESAIAAFVDYSLGTPLVVDIIIAKSECGDLAVQYAITYNLVNLPYSDFVCGGDGMTGVFAYNVGCIPSAPTPCPTPVPPTPLAKLCVVCNSEGECKRFSSGDIVNVSVNGTPIPMSSNILPFSITVDSEQTADALLNWILQQANLGMVAYNSSTDSGVITQSPASATVFVLGDAIAVSANCLDNDLEYTIVSCV